MSSGEAEADRRALRVGVGFATTGRPAVFCETLRRLAAQTHPPDAVIASAPTQADLGDAAAIRPDLRIAPSLPGLTRQRNAVLRVASDCDVLVFFDDDFVPHPGYLAAIGRVFAARPDVAMATGRVLRDGIIGPGLAFADADAAIAASADPGPDRVADTYNAYGCNMAVRMSAVAPGAPPFDEELPLYGWLEDVDFSRRIARSGAMVQISSATGVHLGVKSGRQAGRRLGYSQIANPVYLARKGSFAWPRAVWLMGRNVGMNLARSFAPEPLIDRRGRLRGNLIAVGDALRGRMRPARAAEL